VKAAVLGSGLMGSVISWDLSRSPDVDSVTVADIDEARMAAVRKKAGKKLSTERVDISNEAQLARFLKGFDVVCAALPHGVVHAADVVAAKSGAKMVDIAFEDEQMELDSVARKNGSLLIPGCGLAPGLGGILLSEAFRELKGASEGRILVGGLPQTPQPPFEYRLVFSVIGLLREYTDVARIVREGKVVRVKPFDDVEHVHFPAPVGNCEAFYTDGLASLLYTMKGAQRLDEMTVRYPGHADRMKFLIEAGFLSKEAGEVKGARLSPYDATAALLDRKLREGDPKDVTVLRVTAKGSGGFVKYEMIDWYDRENEVTSMGKTTGYTCSIVAQMVGNGEVTGKGVVPPETAVQGAGVKMLLSEHNRRGVKVHRSSLS
jgi:lysine 6-dehydrogenase